MEEGVNKKIRLNKVVEITGHVFNQKLKILEILFPESKGMLHNIYIYISAFVCYIGGTINSF